MKAQIIASTFIAAAAAAPALQARQNSTSAIPDNTPFGLISLRSASAVHLLPVSASRGGLVLDATAGSQGATCAGGEASSASFYLANGELFLYTPANVTQQLYTDRSGMGQGVLQYSTAPGGYSAPRNAETTGWAADSVGDLTFDGASLLACPTVANSTTGPYSLWVSTGVANPAGNTGCLGIAARATEQTDPAACTYSYTPLSS